MVTVVIIDARSKTNKLLRRAIITEEGLHMDGQQKEECLQTDDSHSRENHTSEAKQLHKFYATINNAKDRQLSTSTT